MLHMLDFLALETLSISVCGLQLIFVVDCIRDQTCLIMPTGGYGMLTRVPCGRIGNDMYMSVSMKTQHLSQQAPDTLAPRSVAAVSLCIPVSGDKAVPRLIVPPQRSDTSLLAQLVPVRSGSSPPRVKALE